MLDVIPAAMAPTDLIMTTSDVDIGNYTPYFSDGLETVSKGLSNNTNFTLQQILDYHRPSITYIDRYVTLVWYIVGIPGNILAAYIWTRKRMRQSSGTYLAVLALADLMCLILQICFETQVVWGHQTLNVPVWCPTFPVLFYTFQYVSPLLVLAFTLERYLQIVHPFTMQTHPCAERTSLIIGILLCTMLGFNAIQGYFWFYDDETQECSPRPNVIQGNPSPWSVWSCFSEMLVFAVVPIAILLLNIRVIFVMREHSKRDERLPKNKSSATTFTLLAVSFYLILSTLPVSIVYILYLQFGEGTPTRDHDFIAHDPTWQRKLDYETVKTVVNELALSHFACNFFIYLATGRMFRRQLVLEFYKLFCPRKAYDMSKRRYSEVHMIKETKTTCNGSESHV